MRQSTSHHGLFPIEIVGRKQTSQLRCHLKILPIKRRHPMNTLGNIGVRRQELLHSVATTIQINHPGIINSRRQRMMNLEQTTMDIERFLC